MYIGDFFQNSWFTSFDTKQNQTIATLPSIQDKDEMHLRVKPRKKNLISTWHGVAHMAKVSQAQAPAGLSSIIITLRPSIIRKSMIYKHFEFVQ